MTWETALLREAQRFAEEVSTERRRPRAFEFDLPLPVIHPETLEGSDVTARIAELTYADARNLEGGAVGHEETGERGSAGEGVPEGREEA